MRGIQKRTTADGVRYQAQIRIKGHKPMSKTFKRKTDAERWKKETETDIRRQLIFPESEAEKRTLAELIDRFLADTLPDRRSTHNVSQTLAWWKNELGHLTLNRVTPAMLKDRWDALALVTSTRTGKRLKNRTLNYYLQNLSAAFTAAIKDYGWAQVNPVLKIRKKPLPKGRTRFLSETELGAFYAEVEKASNPYLKPAILISLATGGRKAEVLSLRWEDVDLREGYVTFRQTKNGEVRRVPVRGKAIDALRKHAEQFRFKSEYVFASRKPKWKQGLADNDKPWEDLRSPFEVTVRNAGIKDFRWHDMRHCAASYLLATGATLAEVGKILGHKSPAMTWRYSHLVKNKTEVLVEEMNRNFL